MRGFGTEIASHDKAYKAAQELRWQALLRRSEHRALARTGYRVYHHAARPKAADLGLHRDDADLVACPLYPVPHPLELATAI